MGINQNISDLFFNTDLSGAAKEDAQGKFDGYDEVKLLDEAMMFLGSLSRLGVDIPTSEDLIDDFYKRL